MNRKTKFTSKADLKEELKIVVDDLSNSYMETNSAFIQDDMSISEGGYHLIGNILKPPHKSDVKRIICSMLLKQVYHAEKLCAKSGEVTFLSAISFINEILKHDLQSISEYELKKNLDLSLEKIKSAISDSRREISEKELKYTIRSKCEGYPYLAEACMEALKLSGLEGKIYVESGSNGDSFVVELKEGYSFKLKTYGFFTEKKHWNLHQCKVLVVDGFVESVSEIDHLLNKFHESMQPLVIVSHGYSEEVVSTLYTNFKKNLLNVIPLRLESDVENLNVINDIGVVCGMDPVSSMKGQLLTFVKYEDIPTIGKISISESQTTIENSLTINDVLAQTKSLIKKRENVDAGAVDELQGFIDKRIKCLTPSQVILTLPKTDKIKEQSMRVTIDEVLREVKSNISHGITSPHTFANHLEMDIFGCGMPNLMESDYDKIFFKAASDAVNLTKKRFPDNFSVVGLYLGIMFGAKTALSIICSAGAVSRDR